MLTMCRIWKSVQFIFVPFIEGPICLVEHLVGRIGAMMGYDIRQQ